MLNLHVNVCYIVLSNIFHLPHHVLALLRVINRFAFNVMFYISVVYIYLVIKQAMFIYLFETFILLVFYVLIASFDTGKNS